MFLKRLPQTTNCTQMQSITGTRAQNYYYYMDAAAEENGILVSNTHTHQNFTTVHLDAITVF